MPSLQGTHYWETLDYIAIAERERKEQMDFIFELGQEVRDTVTGFKGVIMARVQYLTGCNQYHVSQRKLDKNGSRVEVGDGYYDENRLIATKGRGIVIRPVASESPERSGGADVDSPSMK